jgi:ADP-ribose pyrophosphatase
MRVPRIIKRTETRVSPWVGLVAKEVLVAPSLPSETYHSLALADYVAIVARLPDGRLPIVRQFRPAVDCEPWELPAGLLEPNERAEHAAGRELLEETGAVPLNVFDLGTYLPDTGRLENRIRIFGIEAAPPASDFLPEPGMSVALVPPSQLGAMIRAGEFNHMLHVGALAIAELRGFRTGVFS